MAATRPAVLHVDIAGFADDSLEVSWELAGGGPVEVAVGERPDAIDHEHPVARVEGATQVVLHRLRGSRPFVSVAPAGGDSAVVAAERLVPLEGGMNFRDLGGYCTDTGRVRWGHIMGLADGPTEVHKATVARQVLRDYGSTDGMWPTQWIPGKLDAAKAKFAEYLELEVGNL